jgi:hypothetical protein
MKNKTLCLLFLFAVHFLSAQKIKLETGETGVKTYDRPVISKVINNKVYVATFLDNKTTITGFDKVTMKQTLAFTTEKTKYIVNSGVLFLENKIIVIYDKNGVFADVYDYNGKSISKGMTLTSFAYENSWRYYSGDCMSSENGKYFMVSHSNKDSKPAFDYVIYDSEMKLVSKGNVKLPKEYSSAMIRKLLLSNTANIGILAYLSGESSKFSLLRYTKASKTVEEIKVLSEEFFVLKSNVITTRNGIYIGGLYGNNYTVKVKFQGEMTERMIEGAFGVKLNLDDLSVVYSNLTPFSEEQAAAYNSEMLKHPNYSRALEKAGTPEGKIHNEYLDINVDGMAVDKNDNIVLALSSFNGVSETNKFATNIIICQFRLKKEGGLSNFKIVPRRHTSYNDPLEDGFRNSDYFYSSLVCSGECIVSVYNDDEKNIDNLTDMNKNISDADKKSLLAGAEVKNDGNFKKYKLLPQDADVLIMTYCTMYIDETLTFAIATRDKGEVVLLKITSLE